MDVTPLISSHQQVIQSYALKHTSGYFKISGQIYTKPVFITPDVTHEWNAPLSFEALTIDHFKSVLGELQALDVLLLGTGKTAQFLDISLSTELRKNSIRPDIMDTGAACRTYNVLMAEGRILGALLLPYI